MLAFFSLSIQQNSYIDSLPDSRLAVTGLLSEALGMHSSHSVKRQHFSSHLHLILILSERNVLTRAMPEKLRSDEYEEGSYFF